MSSWQGWTVCCISQRPDQSEIDGSHCEQTYLACGRQSVSATATWRWGQSERASLLNAITGLSWRGEARAWAVVFPSCCHLALQVLQVSLCFLLPHLNMKPTCYAIIVCFAAASDLFLCPPCPRLPVLDGRNVSLLYQSLAPLSGEIGCDLPTCMFRHLPGGHALRPDH